MRTSFRHWMWCSLLLLSPILSQAQTLSASQDSSDAYIDVSWKIPVDPCLLDNQQRYKEVSLQLKADDDRGIIEEIKFNDLAQFYGTPQPVFETVFQGSSADDGLIFEFEKDDFIQQINNYTVEFWVKLNANTNVANLLENRGGTGFLQIARNGTDYRIQIKDGQDSQATGISGFPIQAEKWHHFAFAANGLGNTLIYVDGRFEAVIKNKIPLPNFYKIATGTAFQFVEFRLWDRIRTNEEIRANYISTRSDQNNLVILLKATADEIRANDNNAFTITSLDLARIYDKGTQNFTSNAINTESTFVPYLPTPEYQPITGIFRDQIGVNKAIGYTLELEVSGTSNPNANATCSPLEIVGTTLPYQQPSNTSVSQNLIDRINISWQHNSDWVARYVLRRTDMENRSVDLPVSISNFNKGQVYSFSDQFSLNNNRSIVNGESYRYALVGFGLNNEELVTNLGQGTSISIELQASDAGQGNSESVCLQWNDISAYADLIEVHRNGEVLVQLNPSETTFEDNDPIAGSELNYELRLFKNGQVIVSDFDKGSVPPNGVITGKIITRSGELPVKGVDVKLTATNSDIVRTVTTNEQGIFTFSDLVYGLVDTFTLEAQPLPLHQYSPSNQTVVLSKTQPISEETVIFDAFTYNTGFAQIDITQFALRPAPMEDAMDIFWNINSNASNVFIEIIRDGQLIYQDVSGSNLQGSFKDLTGAPEKQYQYTLKAYQIDGDLENNPNSTRLTSKTQTATGVFPDVASVPNFSAVPNDNQGFVTLNWAHTSENPSGYRLFRDDKLIAEVTADLNEFEDRYGEPSAVTTYSIVAFRIIEDLTTESEANESTLIFFPSLPAPQNVSINSNGLMPSLKVRWTATANDDFNFIGYRVYRMEEGGDAELIATIFKDRQLEWTDLQGISGTTYAYQITSFIEAPDGTIYESEAATSAALAFPALAMPSDFQVTTNTQKLGSRTGLTTVNYTWEYPTQVSNFDGFILYGNNDLPLDTLNPQARSSTFLMNENAANSFKISAYRIINQVGYVSNLATATIDANEEEITNINLAQPRNFTASKDVLTHIKLCWENETLSDKRIYRDGELIAEVNNDVESYYDYDAIFGQQYFYEMEGFQDGQMSLKVAAFGSLLNAKKVSGRVYNGKTDIGIANALIRLETTDNQYKQAFTDATGYYEIPSFSAVLSEAMTLTAQHSNLTNGSLSKSIIINATQDNYDLDFVDNNDDPIRFDTVATITSLLATPDRINRHINLHWNTSSDLYDGFELRKGTDLIAFLPKGTNNVYLDSLVAPGIRYTYLIRPYRNSSNGRLVSDYQSIQVVVPELLPVTNLTAITDRNTNQVVLQWSHPYDNHSYYEVRRNEELIATIQAGEELRYVDRTGLPEENYRYSIVPVEQIDQQFFMANPRSVNADFPSVARVQEVMVNTPTESNVQLNNVDPAQANNYALNHVEVSWIYPDRSDAVEGFNIYRNDILVGMVADSVRSFLDFSGIPEDAAEYGVTARVKRADGLLVESNPTLETVAFPELAQPFDLEVQAVTNEGVIQLTFGYPTFNDEIQEVSKFYIYRSESTNFENAIALDTLIIQSDDASTFSFTDIDGIHGADYHYGIQAEAIKNGIPYRSTITSHTKAVQYPPVAPPQNLAFANSDAFNIVDITWDYPTKNSIDYFELRSEEDGVIATRIDKNTRTYRHEVNNPMVQRGETVGREYFLSAVRRIDNTNYRGTASIQAASSGEVEFVKITNGEVDQLGWDLEMNDKWLIVGAPMERGIGAVHIYRFSEPALAWNEWSVIRGEFIGERFGHAVDLDDERIIIGAPEYSNQQGRIVIYEFTGEKWQLEHEYRGEFENLELGYDVAIEDDLAAASLPNYPNLAANARPQAFNYYVISKKRGEWTQVPFLDTSPYEYFITHGLSNSMDFSTRVLNTFVPDQFREGQSIDIGREDFRGTGQQVLVTTRLGSKSDNPASRVAPQYGFGYYKINDNHSAWSARTNVKSPFQVFVDGIPTDHGRQYHGYMDAFEVKINRGKVAIPVGVNFSGGQPQHFEGSFDLFSNSANAFRNGNLNIPPYYHFGYSKSAGTEPIQTRIRVTNEGWGQPDFFSNQIRVPEGTFAQDIGFGKAVDSEGFFNVAGAPGIRFPYRNVEATPFIRFPVWENNPPSNIGALYLDRRSNAISRILDEVNATDGTLDNTKITWKINTDATLTSDNFFKIYRDTTLIADEVDFQKREFSENESTAEEAIPGKVYKYSVLVFFKRPLGDEIVNDLSGSPVADIGFSKPIGEIKGQVLVQGENIGVGGVQVTASAFVNGDYFEETTTTSPNGDFFFNELLFEEGGTDYTITPEFRDHQFEAVEPVNLNIDQPKKEFVFIFDNTSFVVQGTISQSGVRCGLEGKKVRYYETIRGQEFLQDSVFTDENGLYSLVVNPIRTQLEKMRITIDDSQILGASETAGEMPSGMEEQQLVRHEFTVRNVDNSAAGILTNIAGVEFTDFSKFPRITTLNFNDNLAYELPITVQNACGNRVDNSQFKVRIFSLDLCYDTTVVTRINGKTSLRVPPLNYQLVVTGVADANPTQAGAQAANYLRVRPLYNPLLDLHQAAGEEEPDYESAIFTFHTRANIVFDASAFTRYFCDNTSEAAILTQGEDYRIKLDVVEMHNGQTCSVSDGYFVVRNSAAADGRPQRLDYDGGFPDHAFTAGIPNLISPYNWSINVQYYSNAGSLLAERTIPAIVEGTASLPGAGLNVRLDEKDGEIQMPLFVLRDPPGDGSSTSIEKGSTISSELSFNTSSEGGAGFYGEAGVAFAKLGFFADLMISGGGGSAETNTLNLEFETSQTISTSDDADFTGRGADVIVGVGLASSYGVLQGIRVVDCDSIQLFTELGFNPDGITTEWNYTVGFIEGLVDQLKQDSINIREGNLVYRYPDGTLYREEDAILRTASEIRAWEQILEYHDVQTLPHYILCADDSYRDRLLPEDQARLDAWRNAFCGEIGTYEGDEFVLNDRIIWTDDLVTKYRNTVAVTEKLKGVDIGEFDSGDLDFSQSEFERADRLFTNIYETAADTAIVNLTLSGGVAREFSYTAQRTAATDFETTRFFNIEGAAGLLLSSESSAGFGLITTIEDAEVKLGVAFNEETTFQTNQVSEESESSTITVSLNDDDADDNFSVTIIPSPMSNHTPYFALTGGQSSCPGEEALSSRDNAPLSIDNFSLVLSDPITGATGTTLAKNNIPVDDLVEFRLKVRNITNLNLDRVAEIFVTNNTNNLQVFAGGAEITSTQTESIPISGSEEREITIAFRRGNITSAFEFENIRINLKPFCDGEDTRFELEAAAFVEVSLRFQQPCSTISLGAPLEGFVVNRVNNKVFDDRESLTFNLYDLEFDNPNLRNVQLQYRRLGAGSEWIQVAEIPVTDIEAQYREFAADQTPFYVYNWDITGQYDRYPDGEYIVRAISNCGAVGGQIVSNEIHGTIRRSALNAVGYPEPADQVWVRDDEISVSYSRDLDCGIINRPNTLKNNFQLLDRSNNDEPIPFDLICSNGKLTIVPTVDLTDYDGKTMVAIYKDVPDAQGNLAENIEWKFRVIAQQADWVRQEIEFRLYQGETATANAFILNTTSSLVNDLNLQRAGNSDAWLNLSPAMNLTIPAIGQNIQITINGDQAPGNYEEEVAIVGLDGRVPVLKIKATILPPPPVVEEVPVLENDMELVANWRFEDFTLTSTDSLDQIQVWIDNELRGVANIKAVGPFFAAVMKIQGKAEDAGKPLEFRVWHGNALTYYEGIPLSGSIQFDKDTKVGSLDDPELIIVKEVVSVSTKDLEATTLSLTSFPNPFEDQATISFQLERPSQAHLQVFNLMGQLVYETTANYSSGEHQLSFEANGLSAGMYFVRLEADGQLATHSMVLMQ